MKDGDKLLQRLEEAARRRDKLFNFLLILTMPVYYPDYFEMLDYLKANRN